MNLGAQGSLPGSTSWDIVPTGVLKGTTWTVDWGDGSPVWTYTSTADNDIPPVTVTSSFHCDECAYQGTWTVRTPVMNFWRRRSIFVVHGRDIPADGDGLLQMEGLQPFT